MTADGNSDVLGSEYPYAVAQSLGMFRGGRRAAGGTMDTQQPE